MRQKLKETPQDLVSAIRDTFSNYHDTCFGVEYHREAIECSECGMRTVCMVITAKNLDEKAQKSFKELSFVDEINWDVIPYDNLFNIIESNPYPIEEVKNVFSEYSKCKDPVTLTLRVGKFIRDYGLQINNGCITK